MMSATNQENMAPSIVADLIKLGEDLGLEKGLKRGEKRGEIRADRATLRRVLALRKLEPSPEQEQQIDACKDLDTLRHWIDRAIFAESTIVALMSPRPQAGTELMIIEDTVRIGEDRGARASLQRVLSLRKIPPSAKQKQQIEVCTDFATLQRWLGQAIFAKSAAEALR
jgi:hypothetical protein